MILSKDEIKLLYERTAPFYDIALWGYRITGITKQRLKAITLLKLKPGDTVVDLGCGTGANFPLLVNAVGSTGRIIGVDLSAPMLNRARKRINQAGWQNIELIEADISTWQLPPDVAGAIGTFALEMVPEYDAVIRHIADVLKPQGRLALLGLKHPEKWPEWLINIGIWINKPFGVSREYERFHPWESVQTYMKKIEYQELYFGAVYCCIGEKTPLT